MSDCTEQQHADHAHKHGKNCGHTGISHNGHTDYLHDGHLHHMHDGHIDEHVVDVSASSPVQCTPGTRCDHAHGPGCGHDAIPHGDHRDYIVNGRMHHPHGNHCDDHGAAPLA